MTYELEIDVNKDSDYNAIIRFDDRQKAMDFIDTVIGGGYGVIVRGVYDYEK